MKPVIKKRVGGRFWGVCRMRLGRYGSIVGVCLGLAATGAGIVWPIDRDIGGALFVIGIGVVVVSSIWFVVSRESS